MNSIENAACDDDSMEDGMGLLDRSSKFAEFEKMGIRPYDNGTQIFYEEEYDTSRNRMLNQSVDSNESELADYDEDLLNELFDPNPENFIRISKDTTQKKKDSEGQDLINLTHDFEDEEGDLNGLSNKFLEVEFDQLYEELEPNDNAMTTNNTKPSFKEKFSKQGT